MDPASTISPAFLQRVRDLAASALARGGSGLVLESDVSPPLNEVYTETHLALLLYLLYRLDCRDPRRLQQSASRLRVWRQTGQRVDFFHAFGIALLGVFARNEDAPDLHEELNSLLGAMPDLGATAWHGARGNNICLQQLCIARLFAPLA